MRLVVRAAAARDADDFFLCAPCHRPTQWFPPPKGLTKLFDCLMESRLSKFTDLNNTLTPSQQPLLMLLQPKVRFNFFLAMITSSLVLTNTRNAELHFMSRRTLLVLWHAPPPV